jgi:hypothetical protein
MKKVELIGGKILTASDLDKMNEESRQQALSKGMCMITIYTGAMYAAKTKTTANGLEPSEVHYKGKWISIDEFDDICPAYSCDLYEQ